MSALAFRWNFMFRKNYFCFQDVHESWLKVQLRFSAVVEEGERFPLWGPVEGVGAIHAHAVNCGELAATFAGDPGLDGLLRVSESRDVWNLLVALWGCANPALDAVSVLKGVLMMEATCSLGCVSIID